MKKTNWNIACLFFFFTASIYCHAQQKTALIVAIGDYPEETGWMKISSANDVPLVRNALRQQGFEEKDIHLLADAEATKKGIKQAIRTNLINKVERGGIAYFHFSGHGQQVADDDQNEEFDGYDEALVPIDSPIEYKEGFYEGENLLRDDELGELFDEVRAKLGPSGNLLVVLDACHSGTGTRGMSPARGTTQKMAAKNHKVSDTRTRGTGSMEQNGMESRGAANLAPMVAFFGAAPNQLNFETRDENGNGVGSLSYAFCKKFSEAGPNTTYRGLFDKIKLEMSSIAPRQQPQVEGVLDQQILGGSIVGPVHYYRVDNWNDESTVVISGGWLQNLNEGAIVGFYPAETRYPDRTDPIITGQIAKSDPLTSVVYLDGEINRGQALETWAYVLENGFGNLNINVLMDVHNPNISQAIEEHFKEYPIIHFGEPTDLYIMENDRSVQLVTKDDMVLEELGKTMSPKIIANRLAKKLLSFGQAKFLRKLEVASYQIPLEFEFVPVKYDTRMGMATGEIPLENKIDASGNLHFQNEDAFQIRVYNMGDKTAYFTLLDIQPDNQINILIPDSGDVPADFNIAPGESKLVNKIFEIGPPAGTEVFKLIATDEPIDLRGIVQTRGQTKNASPNPFERMFADTYFKDKTSTRGGKSIGFKSSQVNVFSKVFIID